MDLTFENSVIEITKGKFKKIDSELDKTSADINNLQLYGNYSIDFGVDATTAEEFNMEDSDIEIISITSVNVDTLSIITGGNTSSEVVGTVIPSKDIINWEITR
jgi:hypothetical protein